MDPRRLFSEADLDAIRAATGRAEGRTSGEIVPVVVGAADAYAEASWRAATAGAVLGSMAMAVAHAVLGRWGLSWIEIVLPVLAGAVLGPLLVRWIGPCRRLLVDDDTMDLRVARRARQAFLEEEVFSTRDRTGILIFLALFERRVVVLGDAGINAVVDQDAWQGVVDTLVAGIRTGRPGPAVVEAIEACGGILDRHGLEVRPDDIDELRDGLRMEDR
jgi:putative membrane protein